jgi:SAM-dependent methyltransferase/transcriptional regulator with XRE-family HTH domain
MSEPKDLELRLSLKEIADIAGVTSSAVSNWRKRHEDFPQPRAGSATSALFDFNEVEAWLVETGRLESAIPPGRILWKLVDSLREWWSPLDISRFLISTLVYLEASERANQNVPDTKSHPSWRWNVLRPASEGDPIIGLRKVGAVIEESDPTLEGLILEGYEQLTTAPAERLISLINMLEVEARDEGTRVAIFEDIRQWQSRSSRYLTEHTTPAPLEFLMASIVAGLGRKIFDPASGNGGLLLMARYLHESEPQLVGFDVHEEARREARAAFYIYGEAAELRDVNSLCDPSIAEMNADVVLLDPPFNQHDWGNTDTYRDARWTYGVPSPFNANSAWLQVALQALRPGGVALVLQPMSSLEAGHREGETRKKIIESGALDAVVLLPSRLRRDTSAQLVLWVLRRPSENSRSTDVLVIDGSSLGRAGRDEHVLEESELDSLVRAVRARLNESVFDEELVHHLSIPVDQISAGRVLTAYRQLNHPSAPDLEALRQAIEKRRAKLASSVTATEKALRALVAEPEEKS